MHVDIEQALSQSSSAVLVCNLYVYTFADDVHIESSHIQLAESLTGSITSYISLKVALYPYLKAYRPVRTPCGRRAGSCANLYCFWTILSTLR